MISNLTQPTVPPAYPALLVGQTDGQKIVILTTALNNGTCVYSEYAPVAIGESHADWSSMGFGFQFESATVTLSQ